jgi:hypothetical protein
MPAHGIKMIFPSPLIKLKIILTSIKQQLYNNSYITVVSFSGLFFCSHEKIKVGEAHINFKPSDYDPWAEVTVVKMLGAIYTKGDNSMIRGSVVAEVGLMDFAPYAFLKWDMK